MALIDSVKKTLIRLWGGDTYWEVIFKKHGWNHSLTELKKINTEVLVSFLLNENLHIDRSIRGFEDFSLAGKRMIEPGQPSMSLLYHALASPNVYYKENTSEFLQIFPSLFELDALENFIYALTPLDINQLIKKEGNENIALGAFSYEYRQAINTTHKKHADLCFSRTGVARVGTDPHRYEENLRAFNTFFEKNNKNGMRVSPARYGAFIAVRRNIQQQELSVLPYMGRDNDESDTVKNRGFWVPVHKLFPGEECLKETKKLTLSFSIHHENIKLKKVCEFINQTQNRDLSKPPYTMINNLVEMLHFTDDGNNRTASIWISPIPHPLVEEAVDINGNRITIHVLPDPNNAYFAALTLRDNNGARKAPEYVNVRRQLKSNGEVVDLNKEPNVAELVAKGNYDAIMHIDHTCDGWVKVICPEISLPNLPAYSLVTAPDFIPFAEQRELIEWSKASNPPKDYWALDPWALSDSRLLPNIAIQNSPFSSDKNDNTIQTMTAIVGPLQKVDIPQNSNLKATNTRRSSFLPDAAAGEFQPGWDITWDRTADNQLHLSAYGLGSPFLEDAKLCAALSTFWPAAAPDIARSYAIEGWPSICPLSDEEIGQIGENAWDGIPGPKRVQRHGKDYVELPDFNHVDYVTQGLLGKFNIAAIGQINIEEYQHRVDAMWHIYKILNALLSKPKWRVLSFRQITKQEPNFIKDLSNNVTQTMQEPIFSVTIYHRGKLETSDDNKTVFEEITRENKFYVDSHTPRQIWRKKGEAAWQVVTHENEVPA
jgi:hypothetical protein